MRKLLILALATIVTFAAVSVAYANTTVKSFTDIKTTNWAYESVNAMSEKGILKGYSDGTFKPSNTVTYGEFIKMALIGATKEDIGNSSSGNWAKSYYNKALELGYFGSTDIKAEQLNNIITRSDMALIISNILGETKIDDYDTLDESISDVDSTTKHDYDIIKSYATGILTGYADGTFKPEGTLTRAEAVTVIYRLVDESKRVIPTDKKVDTAITEKKVDIKASINSTKTFSCVQKTAKLGDYGIEKFVITSNGYVAIYSTIKYDAMALVIDNVVTSWFVNPNGKSYWEENGYYIYYSEPQKDGINVKEKIPSLSISGMDEVIEFTNVNL